MSRIFSIFVALFLSLPVFSAVFSEDQVGKKISVKVPVHESRLNNPSGTWTDVYFEFLIQKDSSLWLRPLLGANETTVKMAHFFTVDRTDPVELKMKGFVPVEFFQLDGRSYMVVKHSAPFENVERFLVGLNPELGHKPKLARAMLSIDVSLPLGVNLLFSTTGIMPIMGTAVLTAITSYNAVKNICREYDNCMAQPASDLKLVQNYDGYPLVVGKYIIDSAKPGKIVDVELKDSQNKPYSLKDLGRGVGFCEYIATHTESAQVAQ